MIADGYRSDVDVAIVGAGPAGSAAAISLTEAGYECAIVERSEFPRYRPGETLHPGIQPLIAQLGCERELLRAGFSRFSGIFVETKGQIRLSEFGSDKNGPWYGFQAWREDFDQILLNRCRELGVQVYQPRRAVRLLFDSSRVHGFETTDGPLFARFTVDAAGGRHWLANQLGLPISRFSPKLFARFGYSNLPQTESPLPCFITDESGWTWHAQVRDQLYHWTRLTLDAAASTDSGVQQPFPGERGADVTWRCVAQPSGPGYFIVGDAAAVLDPASSHGVLRALMSGIMAADVIQRVDVSPIDEARLTSGYCDWWSGWLWHDMDRLRDWYREAGLNDAWEQPMHQSVDLGGG